MTHTFKLILEKRKVQGPTETNEMLHRDKQSMLLKNSNFEKNS